jgi:CelD/BcsL family acetyltransferase involved in cellulose biosynthesis
MDASILTEAAELDLLYPEWRALYESSDTTLFQNPEWHRAWWRHIGYPKGWTPHIAAGRCNGRLVALAPLAVIRKSGLRRLEWAGTTVFDYPDALVASGTDASPLWKAIRRSRQYDFARLRDVRTRAVSRRSLEAFAREAGQASAAHAINLRARSGDEWFATLSRRTRSNHQANLRRLQREGQVKLVVAALPSEVTGMIRHAVQLKTDWSRARGKDNIFTQGYAAGFLEELSLRSQEEGVLHLSALCCNNQMIAIHAGFISADGFYYYMPVYDPRFAKESPGRVHLIMLVMLAIDRGCTRFDFLRGAADYKSHLATEEREMSDYIFSRGIIGTAARAAYLFGQYR